MFIMLILSLVLAVSFVGIAMMRLKSLPESISALVYVFNDKWLGLWMPCLFLIGAGYIQPEGWLGKATKGKWVFLAECTCYVALMGTELMYYLS